MWNLIANEYAEDHKFGCAEFSYKENGSSYGYSVMHLVMDYCIMIYKPYEIDEDDMNEIRDLLLEDLNKSYGV